MQVALKLVRTESRRSADDVLSLLTLLQTLDTANLRGALQHATDVLLSFFGAECAEAFLYDPADESLVALASSHTAVADRQRAVALQHLALSHGGRIAWVYEQQQPFRDGNVTRDAFELVAIRRDLGVRSTLAVPFAVSDERRGVLVVRSVSADHFGEADLELLRFVGYWVALVHQQHTSARDDRALAV